MDLQHSESHVEQLRSMNPKLSTEWALFVQDCRTLVMPRPHELDSRNGKYIHDCFVVTIIIDDDLLISEIQHVICFSTF